MLGSDSSPKGSWRALYKKPTEKRVGDLQWRIVHGVLATNRHIARLNPLVGEGCPFCNASETVIHAFMECYRLKNLMQLVKVWSLELMGSFNVSLFIYGAKYSENKKKVIILNFLYGMVKLAIWCTRKNKVEDSGCIDPILLTKCFVKKRLTVEYAFYSITHNVQFFFHLWGFNNFLCEPDGNGSFNLNIL